MPENFKHKITSEEKDPNASNRKEDHIKLALEAQVKADQTDQRFFFEPMLSAHPSKKTIPELFFAEKRLNVPVWVSSMTGGTAWAGIINKNLAKACGEFGMGMGLGSCRGLLYSDEYLSDFQVRKYMGSQPLFANLGIAQIEQLWEQNEFHRISELIKKLEVDGLIIHVNPLQEFLQPEGDKIKFKPIDTIKRVLDSLSERLIIKEVGQGMGRESLRQLLNLPLEAIDFAAHGGTNFAKLEILRNKNLDESLFMPLCKLGHTSEEMVALCNELVNELGEERKCNQLIISGGVSDFLDGYYLIQKSVLPSIYGQASGFLKHARGEYELLQSYVKNQIDGLNLAYSYLRVK
jgi:isopentenyl-diphosphate delta-isomerase